MFIGLAYWHDIGSNISYSISKPHEVQNAGDTMTPNDDFPGFEECPSCDGLGYYDVGDCEDGVTDDCGECNGTGLIKVDISE